MTKKKKRTIALVLCVLIFLSIVGGWGMIRFLQNRHVAILPYLWAGRTQKVGLIPGVDLDLVWIPKGTFRMGGNPRYMLDNRPLHTVELEGFWMGKYEVTQEQYETVMSDNPSHFKGRTNPVDSVSWHDAVEFCRRLSKKTGDLYRLPTEAEWEYACRAGTKTDSYWGNDVSQSGPLYSYANVYNHFGRTMPVGSLRPNRWGLYDMVGNVSEWCSDWYSEGYYAESPRKNPLGPPTGEERVCRGGNWRGSAFFFSAGRDSCPPNIKSCKIGFRVVRERY